MISFDNGSVGVIVQLETDRASALILDQSVRPSISINTLVLNSGQVTC